MIVDTGMVNSCKEDSDATDEQFVSIDPEETEVGEGVEDEDKEGIQLPRKLKALEVVEAASDSIRVGIETVD